MFSFWYFFAGVSFSRLTNQFLSGDTLIHNHGPSAVTTPRKASAVIEAGAEAIGAGAEATAVGAGATATILESTTTIKRCPVVLLGSHALSGDGYVHLFERT